MPTIDMAITVITEEQIECLTRWPYCYDQHLRKNLLIANAESDRHVLNGDRKCRTHVRCYYMDLHGNAHENIHGLLTRVLDAKE